MVFGLDWKAFHTRVINLRLGSLVARHILLRPAQTDLACRLPRIALIDTAFNLSPRGQRHDAGWMDPRALPVDLGQSRKSRVCRLTGMRAMGPKSCR